MGTFFLGLMSGLLIAILGELAKRQMFAAKLDVSTGNRAPFVVDVPVTGGNVPQRRYVRLRIANLGHDSAHGCRAYVTNLQQVVNGAPTSLGWIDAIPLAWSYSSEATLDVVNGVPLFVDILYVEPGNTAINPCLPIFPNAYTQMFTHPGTLRFTIVVAAAGGLKKTVEVDINWNGVWNNIGIAMHSVLDDQ